MTPDDSHGWWPEDAPRVRPLSYPGRWLEHSVLLAGHMHHPLHLLPGRRLGQARVAVGDPAIDEVPLDDALERLDAPRPANRAPVLAVGSNAAPSQLRLKFQGSQRLASDTAGGGGGVVGGLANPGAPLVTPMVLAEVEGLASGIAGMVSRPGYLPATPVVGRHLRSRLFVQWLDARQLATLDATEPGYRRVLLPAGDPAERGVRITLPSGEVLGACYAYVAARGHLLVDGDGGPTLLGDQRELLTRLLGASRRLRSELGTTADSWVERITLPGKLDTVNEILRAEGWIGRDPWLDRLAVEQDAPCGGVAPEAAVDPATVSGARMRTYGEILPAAPLAYA